MKVGSLDLGNKAILAPMAEVTDAPFRQICKENGAGLTFTQMISAKGVVENAFNTLKVLAFNRDEKPIGIQFLANDADYLSKAIKEIIPLKPDLIDLNSGCSVPNVCKFGLGASLLDDPKNLGKLVRKMADASKGIPVSVKMRIGKDNQKINAIEVAKEIEANGASIIIVHGRTRANSYADQPNLDWIKKVKESVSIPVVANGSLFTPQDCLKMIEYTKCDSLLLARGALGNPFLFYRTTNLIEKGIDPGMPEIDEIKNTAIKHLKLQILDSGEEQGIKKIRKYLIWYFRFFNGITFFIEKIFKLNTEDLVIEFLNEHTSKIKNNLYPKEDLKIIEENFNNRVLFWLNTNNEIAYQ